LTIGRKSKDPLEFSSRNAYITKKAGSATNTPDRWGKSPCSSVEQVECPVGMAEVPTGQFHLTPVKPAIHYHCYQEPSHRRGQDVPEELCHRQILPSGRLTPPIKYTISRLKTTKSPREKLLFNSACYLLAIECRSKTGIFDLKTIMITKSYHHHSDQAACQLPPPHYSPRQIHILPNPGVGRSSRLGGTIKIKGFSELR